jgi:hypothetical protein
VIFVEMVLRDDPDQIGKRELSSEKTNCCKSRSRYSDNLRGGSLLSFARRLAQTEFEMRAFRVAFILVLLAAPASADETNVGHGVICDTLEQMEHFAALRSDGKEAEVALQAVNHDVTGPNACTLALVKFTDGKPMARLSINGRPASVFEITVHAVSNGYAWNEVSATVQYILVPEKGLIA